MATKTISIELDVYDRLKTLRKTPSESFSQVLRRELSGRAGVSALDLLELSKKPGGLLGISDEDLVNVETIHRHGRAWPEAWTQ